jgi:hypothetical protein
MVLAIGVVCKKSTRHKESSFQGEAVKAEELLGEDLWLYVVTDMTIHTTASTEKTDLNPVVDRSPVICEVP